MVSSFVGKSGFPLRVMGPTKRMFLQMDQAVNQNTNIRNITIIKGNTTTLHTLRIYQSRSAAIRKYT